MRTVSTVHAAEGEDWYHFAGHDTQQRIGTGEIAECKLLEELCRRVAEGLNAGGVE